MNPQICTGTLKFVHHHFFTLPLAPALPFALTLPPPLPLARAPHPPFMYTSSLFSFFALALALALTLALAKPFLCICHSQHLWGCLWIWFSLLPFSRSFSLSFSRCATVSRRAVFLCRIYNCTSAHCEVMWVQCMCTTVSRRGGGLGSSTIFKKFHEPYAPS